MNLKRVRTLFLIVAAGVTFSMGSVGVHAEKLSNMLPSAGFGTKVEEGVTVSTVKDEVKQLVEESSDTSESVLDETSASTVRATVTLDKEVVEAVIPEVVVDEKSKEEEEFSNLVIARVDNYVNVRDIPSEEGEVVGKLYDRSVGSFIEEVDGWYKIQSGNCTGYVKGEYCVTGEEAIEVAKEVGTRIATVTTTTLKVREEPSLEASVLGLVPIEEELIVLEEVDGWVKVDIEEGHGYVSTEYVELKTEFVKAESKEEEEARLKKEKEEREKANAAAAAAKAAKAAQAAQAAENAEGAETASQPAETTSYTVSGEGSGASVANYALQFVGNPYVFGGSSLTNGTDCSGFVMSVYANFGVSLPHSSSGDRSVGYDVGGLDNAQPGDIVCYSGHVGIYIGGGQIVHASTSKTGIVVGNATYRTPLCVRRIF